MIPEFCQDCTVLAEELAAQAQQSNDALRKSDRIRAQLRTAADTLQRRLALTQKQLLDCKVASAPSSCFDDVSTRRPSEHGYANSTDGSSCSREIYHRRRSEGGEKELSALHAEIANRETENELLGSQLEELKRKFAQSEALAQDRLRELETVKSTWVVPTVFQRVEEELEEMKMREKESAKVSNPLDALDSLQRDLEGAAKFRKVCMGDAQKSAQLTLRVAELQDTLQRREKENAEYRTLLSDLDGEAQGLRAACMHSTSNMVQRYDDLRNELNTLREERSNLYSRVGTLEGENTHWSKINEEGRAKRLESELRVLAVEIERLRSCNAALCSQLFGDANGKPAGDNDANMLLQGLRPMDDSEEVDDDIHLRTIVRLQQKLSDAEEKHLTEKEQLMEKVRQLERQNAARLAPSSQLQTSPVRKTESQPVNRLQSLVSSGISSGWSLVGR